MTTNMEIMYNWIASLLYNPKRKRDEYAVYEDYPSLGALTGGCLDKLEESVEYDTDEEYETLYEEPTMSCVLM